MSQKPDKDEVDCWQVYILRCADNSLYTGITTDISRRIQEHNENNALAARYTRGRRPTHLVYQENNHNRSSASKREAEIKKMSKSKKELLITSTDF